MPNNAQISIYDYNTVGIFSHAQILDWDRQACKHIASLGLQILLIEIRQFFEL